MRKRIITTDKNKTVTPDDAWLDLEEIVEVEISVTSSRPNKGSEHWLQMT
jgi:hypothetical protein